MIRTFSADFAFVKAMSCSRWKGFSLGNKMWKKLFLCVKSILHRWQMSMICVQVVLDCEFELNHQTPVTHHFYEVCLTYHTVCQKWQIVLSCLILFIKRRKRFDLLLCVIFNFFILKAGNQHLFFLKIFFFKGYLSWQWILSILTRAHVVMECWGFTIHVVSWRKANLIHLTLEHVFKGAFYFDLFMYIANCSHCIAYILQFKKFVAIKQCFTISLFLLSCEITVFIVILKIFHAFCMYLGLICGNIVLCKRPADLHYCCCTSE